MVAAAVVVVTLLGIGALAAFGRYPSSAPSLGLTPGTTLDLGSDPASLSLELRDCTIAQNPCALIQGPNPPKTAWIPISTFVWGGTRFSANGAGHIILGAAGLNLVNITEGSGCGLNANGFDLPCSYSTSVVNALLGGHKIQAIIHIFASGAAGITFEIFQLKIGFATQAYVVGYTQSGFTGASTPGTDNIVIRTCDVTLVHLNGGQTASTGDLCRPRVSSTTTLSTITLTNATTVTSTSFLTSTSTVITYETTTATASTNVTCFNCEVTVTTTSSSTT
ncbi:MAG: hypothetical protein HY247_05525 [archaeon]|nr:MAG: hypothetical protein HY247_05525 [archaeon]